MYIVFEGKDFAGKTTMINKLKKVFPTARTVAEPYKGTPELVAIRNIIASGNEDRLYKAYLSVAQRAYMHDHVVKPIFDCNEKAIVISDRSFITSCVYQANSTRELNNVFDLNRQWLTHHAARCIPDIIVYMEIDYETYLKRKANTRNRLKIDKVEEQLMDENEFNEYSKRYAQVLGMCERYMGSRILINPSIKDISDLVDELIFNPSHTQF